MEAHGHETVCRQRRRERTSRARQHEDSRFADAESAPIFCCLGRGHCCLRRKLVRGGGGAGSKRVVLTFDDAVKSHRTFVAPLLKELGFNATFYVTHRWMNDAENFMTWQDIAEIHEMGFEIGNHTWTHADASMPRTAGRFAGELVLVENALEEVGVPRPTSLAWCGNSFGPEALGRLRELGYRFARRGKDPEGRDRTLKLGLTYDPVRHDPLLIPSTAVSILDWDLAHL